VRPSQVLDYRADLIDRLGSQQYVAYLGNFLASLGRTDPDKRTRQAWVESAPAFAKNMALGLRASEVYHVQAEMMSVLKAAASELDGLDYLVHDRLLSEQGFLVFDHPWLTKEVTGKTVSYSALQWSHTSFEGEAGSTPGIWVFYYTDIDDPNDEVSQTLFEGKSREEIWDLGRYHMSHCQFLAYEQRVGPAEIMTPDDYRTLFGYRQDEVVAKTPNDARLMVALFRLLGQVLVEVKDAPIERAASRRARKANLPARVQTVKLRRKEIRYLNEGDHESGHIDWQHSWIVRGHWAWRKCGSEHVLAEPYEKGYRARIYVAPYLKGPEGKPLVITEKVFDLAQ
jgi:hypothetical protein